MVKKKLVGFVTGVTLAAITIIASSCSRSEPEQEWRPLQVRDRAESSQPPPTARGEVPPYHESAAAARPFPRLVPAAYFRNPIVARAYEVAAEIPEVIAQQPCYCKCDKFGHRSLLDCYASDHGAG